MKTRLRYLALLIAAIGLLPACSGCEPDSPPDETPKQVERTATADAGAPDVEKTPREAFGVPFPPEIRSARVNEVEAQVVTRLSIEEVESFFRLRLTDFEFVQESDMRLRVFGLHEHQPNIEIVQRAARYDTRLWIRPKPENYKVGYETTWGEVPGEAQPAEEVVGTERPKPQMGQPVKTILPSGEEFAPGARWGEPYIPPEGTPLAHPRYKSNWGRPYGEWTLQ